MGKNFDLFIECKNFVPEHLRRYINRAKLFEFDLFPTETMKRIPQEDVADLAFNFCLPFPVVAVEDKTSCVILWDKYKDAVGIEHPRGMMEIADTENYLEDESFRVTSQDRAMGITEESKKETNNYLRSLAQEWGQYPIVFRSGESELQWCEDMQKWGGTSHIGSCAYILHDQVIDFVEYCKHHPGWYKALETDFVRGTVTAYEELLNMSTRSSFILEKAPVNGNKKKSKYLKSHERPVYTVLKPNAIRRVTGIVENSGTTGKRELRERRAYVRREHERVLSSPKFTKKRGQTVKVKRTYVPAVWRGDSATVKGKHSYRVILDLPKGVRDSCEEKTDPHDKT